MISTTTKGLDFRIKDIGLAHWGRKEIEIAQHEMPGLMALRSRYHKAQPLKEVRISGSLHTTIQTAILVETLVALGAQVRWSSCNIFSTQDHAAAALVMGPPAGIANDQPHGVPVFAWKNESLQEYWELLFEALNFEGCGPQLIVDDGGDATLMVHLGYEAEEAPALLEQKSSNPDEIALFRILQEIQQSHPGFWHRAVEELRGVSEETTTGVMRLYERHQRGTLLFPAIDVNSAITKSKFDNLYGCRESLVDGIKRATDTMIAGKVAVVCGYGDVGKGCAQSLRNFHARVIVTEIDPICALQASLEGYEVRTIEQILDSADIYVTATGNRDVITLEHILQMKDQAILCNIGHFDTEIQVDRLRAHPEIQCEEIKPQVEQIHLPSGSSLYLLAAGRLVNLGCATGHPSFVMSHSFSNQVIAQLELWRRRDNNASVVTTLPRFCDEEIARLHLPKLGATLTTLTPQQAQYINVAPEGPYKTESYRY